MKTKAKVERRCLTLRKAEQIRDSTSVGYCSRDEHSDVKYRTEAEINIAQS